MKSFLQHLQENEDPQTFTTTRREVMARRGMDPDYIAKIKKYRADPKNAELLSPFALPSVEDKDLDRPVKINYGPLGSFPDDPTPEKKEEMYKEKSLPSAVGWAKVGGDVRILAPGVLSPGGIPAFRIGELEGKDPNVGQNPDFTYESGTFGEPVHAISPYPALKDSPFDIIGHEVAHTAQPAPGFFSRIFFNQQKRVVGPLPGDTPENKEVRDYLFNKWEPAARANEYKAWLKARGLNVNADMSSDDYKKAMDELRKSNNLNPWNYIKQDLEFYNTPQGEALFRGAKANTDKDDPTKNKPVTTPSMPTAIAEHWSRMAKKIKKQ